MLSDDEMMLITCFRHLTPRSQDIVWHSVVHTLPKQRDKSPLLTVIPGGRAGTGGGFQNAQNMITPLSVSLRVQSDEAN